eukprot:gene48544-59448_t
MPDADIHWRALEKPATSQALSQALEVKPFQAAGTFGFAVRTTSATPIAVSTVPRTVEAVINSSNNIQAINA